jgi:hypothetical protein
MPKFPKPKNIDYSSDSLIKASARLAKIALKNVQPPPLPVIDEEIDPAQTQTITRQPVAISDVMRPMMAPTGNSTIAYNELLKYFGKLNNHLDSLLTDLDARNEGDLFYPKITMKNKQNHNPNFNKYMTKQEKEDYLEELGPEIRNKMEHKINYVINHSEGYHRDIDTLKKYFNTVVPPHLLTSGQKDRIVRGWYNIFHGGACWCWNWWSYRKKTNTWWTKRTCFNSITSRND